jgi:hypothetical protein
VTEQSSQDLSARGKAAALSAIAVSLAIVGTAERDLQRRRAAEVRGQKFLWRLVSLSAPGALCYLRWGRRAT